MPDAPPTQPAARDRDTEDRILAAAHAVFLRHGTHGARMQDIADEAGVNKALLHYYFRSKDGLAEEVFRRTFAGVIPVVMRVLASDEPLDAKVRRVVALYVDTLGRNSFLPGYLLCEMHQHPERVREVVARLAPVPLAQVSDVVLAPLRRQLAAAAAAGTMRAITAEHFVVHLFSLCIFPFAARPLLSMVLGFDAAAFDAFAREREAEVTRFVLEGLRP